MLEWACRARKLTTQEQELAEEMVKVLVSSTTHKHDDIDVCLLTVCFLYDSGSDAHVTNDERVFVKGTLKALM